MNKNDFEEAWIRRAGNPKEMAALRDRINRENNRKMRNKTYRRAALEKAFLIALLILLIVWIVRGQTVELSPTPTPVARATPVVIPDVLGFPKLSPADIYARMCKEEEHRMWNELWTLKN